MKYLGETFDIHCGGVDLIFPHHENEIAQSEAANGCEFAHYWLHNGHINVDNRKMSKSAGNFFTVRDAAAAYGYETIRLFMLSSHYRSPINYSKDVLESAKAGLQRLYTTKNNLEYALKSASGKITPDEEELLKELPTFKDKFVEKMDDDLNTADALSVIFDLARWINTQLAGTPSLGMLNEMKALFSELAGVLNILNGEQEQEIPAEIKALVQERTAARANKDFARADEIRDQLAAMGVLLEDGKDGVKILMKQ
jgi:cysteinyl-tRNA synthetase